jgi:hypothetical protein
MVTHDSFMSYYTYEVYIYTSSTYNICRNIINQISYQEGTKYIGTFMYSYKYSQTTVACGVLVIKHLKCDMLNNLFKQM